MKWSPSQSSGPCKDLNSILLVMSSSYSATLFTLPHTSLIHGLFCVQLLQKKVNVNAANEHGNTPLHYACFWNYELIAEDLINNGALVSIANRSDETPLDKARHSTATFLRGKLIVRCSYLKLSVFLGLSKIQKFNHIYKVAYVL